MSFPRRWLAALLIALGLLPGVERVLLAHVHAPAAPALHAATAPSGAPVGAAHGWLDCAACHARATLDGLVFDAHPEQHGAAPFSAPPRTSLSAPPLAPAEGPPVRGPPLRIV